MEVNSNEQNRDILKQLEAGVLNEKPGTASHKLAVDALSEYLRTYSDMSRTEAELRMKQNAMDDDLSFKHTELELKSNEMDIRKEKDLEEKWARERELALRERELDNRQIKDEAEAKAAAASEKRQTIMDVIKTVVSVAGLAINTALAVVILKQNEDGKPLLTNHGRALSNSIFKWKNT